jgi:hypothetical protein
MSGSGMRRMAVAAAIAALGTLASAADLSPPSPTRHRPNRSLGHLLPPPEADLAPRDWGATSILDGPPVRFITDPSGVIGGTMFDSNHELSPDWLTGIEDGALPGPYREFQRNDGP